MWRHVNCQYHGGNCYQMSRHSSHTEGQVLACGYRVYSPAVPYGVSVRACILEWQIVPPEEHAQCMPYCRGLGTKSSSLPLEFLNPPILNHGSPGKTILEFTGPPSQQALKNQQKLADQDAAREQKALKKHKKHANQDAACEHSRECASKCRRELTLTSLSAQGNSAELGSPGQA